jgi:hypothetical protein
MKSSAFRQCGALALILGVFFLAGCSGGGSGGGGGFPDPRQEQRDKEDLRTLGIAFHDMDFSSPKPPAKPDDLGPSVKNDQRLLGRLRSGEIVFLYNVRLDQMIAGAGATNTILAYLKDVPTNGGWVLFGDASIRKLSADEFNKAPKAKPKGK